MKESFNSRLEISRILDCVFLHGTAKPCLAVLFEDHRMERHIKTYNVDTRERELMGGPWHQDKVNGGAKMLIPVPAPACGELRCSTYAQHSFYFLSYSDF